MRMRRDCGHRSKEEVSMKLSVPIFRLKRRAKLLARETRLPLHCALDTISRQEGFQSWSHLSAAFSGRGMASDMLAKLRPGDLVLLGARPGHGKTLLGLDLVIEAVRAGRRAFFFTLEDPEKIVVERLRRLGAKEAMIGKTLILDTSDDICAQHIIETAGGSAGAMIVIDYLQLLDQQRRHPDLAVQVGALRSFAKATGSIVVVLSQIHRRFESTGKNLPDLSDIRLANPLDLTLFSKSCFVHDGRAQLEALS
jgi:replicative DNA helicase